MVGGLLLLVLALLPCTVSPSTIAANKLFQNTIKRWNIDVSSTHDRLQRWKRFTRAKETVDRTTRGVVLDSLNRFTVLNDREYEETVGPLRRQLNSFNVTMEDLFEDFPAKRSRVQKRGYEDVELQDSVTYWEEEVGFKPAPDQYGCGSCWSFPNVATMEVLYKDQTGEAIEFSEQYFVDCTFDGDGCGGGSISEGYKLTLMRQYLMLDEDWPYTADYHECAFADDIETFKNNALEKLWITSYITLSTNENAMLNGLLTSPVTFGSYVSNDIFDYSGGIWTDSSCSSDPNPHSMLLVGYTETYLRVRNSYGSDWGENGFVNYERGTVTLDSCNFYKSAITLTTTFRREIEYVFCNSASVGTRGECGDSCDAMNTDTETGWTLAVIPTKYHNTLVVDMINEEYPGVKNNDKFNYLWIGLIDMTKTSDLSWVDNFTPTNYMNLTENVAKYGMINKNTGSWYFKNSLTYEARGLCSRPVTCWDIGTAIANGVVTFDAEILVEGTVASVTCDTGYQLIGEYSFTCSGGVWDEDLPVCEEAEQLQERGIQEVEGFVPEED